MSTFLYEAYDKDGATVRGEYEAQTSEEVVEHLLHRSLSPVSIRSLKANSATELSFSSLFKRLSPVDVLFLVRNLATTLKAGMSMVEALDIMIADTDRPYLRYVLQTIQAGMKSGLPFSKGFEQFRGSFPPAFIGMLRAGEASGELDSTLASLGAYLAKEYNLRQAVRAAMIYPVVLLCASAGVVALLLIVVLPRLSKAFAQSGVELPFITKVFLALSNALTYSIWLDLAVVAGLVWFFTYFRRTVIGRRFMLSVLMRTPVARDVVKKVALVRFTRTFGHLIGGGVSAIEALDIAADSVGNDDFAAAIRKAGEDLQHGISLSHSLPERRDLFPSILIGLIVVGEKTGTLSAILLDLADFYDEEAGNRLKNLTSILEPILLLVMGLIVGSIALSIMLPIYQLIGKVG